MNADFERIYASVPAWQKEALSAFRRADHRRSVRHGGFDWGYVARGDGGRPIVFLPGGFARADMWLHPMRAFETGRRVLAVDCSLETFRAEACVDATLAILEREGIDRYDLVGSSYGGGLAQHLLQRDAARVGRAVLSHCTAITDRLAAQMSRLHKVARWMPRPAIELQWGAAQRRAGPEGLEWSAYARAYLEEVGERVDKDILLRFLRESASSAERFRFDREAIAAWEGELMLMSSRDDPTTFAELDELRARYPNAAEHLFDHGGHATLLFRPDAYTAALADFLT